MARLGDRVPAGGGTARALVAVLGFAIALGSTAVVYPLLALEVGFAPAVVGAFTAVSAAFQLLTRFCLPWLLSRCPDRSIIIAAALMIGMSAGALIASTSLASFLLAQALQGSARALFWTASQTHAVRTSGTAVQRIAEVQVVSNVGTLVAPAIAGSIAAASFNAALAATVTAALAATAAATRMLRRDPYVRPPKAERGPLWWRADLSLGYWTSFASGGWRGLLDSFVPVILAASGIGAAAIGFLLSTAEGAQLLAGVWLARAKAPRLHVQVRVGAGLIALCAVALPIAPNVLTAAVVLALAGWGSGMVSTLGPGITGTSARPDEQGAALAVAGAYRAGARMSAPGAVAALGPALGIPVAMSLAAASMVAPALRSSLRWRAGSP